MLELLKKIGIPASVAAVIATVVTLLPFIFKIDERYAKAEELKSEVVKIDERLNALTVEVGRLAGIQQVLVTIAGQQSVKAEVQPKPIEIAAATPVEPTVSVPAQPSPAPVLRTEPVVVPVAPSASSTPTERKETLQQVQRALEASQRNIERIQKY